MMKTLFSKYRKPKNPGKFIVLEGIDGSGKSTQLKYLQKELEFAGLEFETIHFPQHGKPSAFMVDNYLAGKYGPLSPQAASVFYAVDRFEAAQQIREHIKDGKIVLCDRYVTANAAHQGGKLKEKNERLKFFKWLDNLEYGIFNIPRPDLVVILNVPAEAAIQMLKLRKEEQDHKDKMHEGSLEHLQNSYNVYMEIATLFPNTKVVNCVENSELLLPDQIHNRVWELVRRIALKDYKF